MKWCWPFAGDDCPTRTALPPDTAQLITKATTELIDLHTRNQALEAEVVRLRDQCHWFADRISQMEKSDDRG